TFLSQSHDNVLKITSTFHDPRVTRGPSREDNKHIRVALSASYNHAVVRTLQIPRRYLGAQRRRGSLVTSHNESGPILDGLVSQVPDIDQEETAEWLESLEGVIQERGGLRARYVLTKIFRYARKQPVRVQASHTSDYVNTIGARDEPWFPGDEDVERTYRRWIRWNAAVMVHRAQRPGIAVGRHLSSYASAATLYEVGQNHFFRGKDHPGGGDQVFYQGHSSPGFYARAFLEGRLSEQQMDGFRQELTNPGGGIPSYPHPRLLNEFWEFPTVSMGIGPMNAIYQAWFNKYLHDRGIRDT